MIFSKIYVIILIEKRNLYNDIIAYVEGSGTLRIIDLTSKEQGRIFALVYGASGTGKTHLMGTVGELGRTLIIDIDQGTMTLKNAEDIRQAHYTDNITVVSFDKFKDLDEAYKLVYANDPKKWSLKFNTQIDQPFDWIIWDTWSEIQWYMLEELRSKDSEMKGNGLDFRKNVQIQHWGQMTDLNKLAVQELRKCEVNQIFTMQEKLDKDELSGQIFGGPAIHGKMMQEMPVYFDIVIHTYTDLQGKYCATTKSKGRWPAKTRLGEGRDFIDPKASQIFGR